MTVSSSVNRAGPYLGNGSTTVFARNFLVLDADHLRVYATTDGVTTEVTTGITKDGIGSASGNVTFLTAPAAGTEITLIRDIPLTQETDYSNQGVVAPEQVEDDFDLQEMKLQDVSERVDRSIKLPVSSALSDVEVAEPEAGRVLVGRGDGLGFEAGPAVEDIGAYLRSVSVGHISYEFLVTDAAGQSDFTIPIDPVVRGNVDVFVTLHGVTRKLTHSMYDIVYVGAGLDPTIRVTDFEGNTLPIAESARVEVILRVVQTGTVAEYTTQITRPDGQTIEEYLVELDDLTKTFATRGAAETWVAAQTSIPTGFVVSWPGMSLRYDGTTNLLDGFDGFRDNLAGRYIINYDGQSNIQRRDPYSWNPPENLVIWNNTGDATGTRFVECPNSEVNFALAEAARLAELKPDQMVFCIQSGNAGRAIANWLPAPPEEDAYAINKARVEAALAYIGESEIDRRVWWQGASDRLDPERAVYPDNFEAVEARLLAETWYPANCPTRIMGMASSGPSDSFAFRMNLVLERLTWNHNNRSFFQSWKATDNTVGGDWLDSLHPTPEGFLKIGKASAEDWLNPTAPRTEGMLYVEEFGRYGFGPDAVGGAEWDFHWNLDEESILRITNLATDAASRASLAATTAEGTLKAQAYGAPASGRSRISWSGVGAMLLECTNAAAGIIARAGKAAETFRINPNIFRLTLGATPGDDNLGTVAEFFVTQDEALFRVPLTLTEPLTMVEQSADPDDPSEGQAVKWISDGTGSGDAGDYMMKITQGGTTKTITLVDWSAA